MLLVAVLFLERPSLVVVVVVAVLVALPHLWRNRSTTSVESLHVGRKHPAALLEHLYCMRPTTAEQNLHL